MALSKTVEIDGTGVQLSYWRILHFTPDIEGSRCAVTLAGYLDGTARNEGKFNFCSKEVIAENLPKSTYTNGNVLAALYAALKNHEMLSGAEDC